MKNSIKSLLIFTLLIVWINQSNWDWDSWISTCETLKNEDTKEYIINDCTKSNYYSLWNGNFIDVKNNKWNIINNIKTIDTAEGHFITLYETKYWNHIFQSYLLTIAPFGNFYLIDNAIEDYLNSEDGKKDLYLWLYVDWKQFVRYKWWIKWKKIEIKDFLNKNNIFYYIQDQDSKVEKVVFKSIWKYEKWIFLRKKHLDYLNKFLKRIPEKKYDLVLNKLDKLIKKFDKRKDYKWKYLLEALTYLYSEIKIEQFKSNEIIYSSYID